MVLKPNMKIPDKVEVVMDGFSHQIKISIAERCQKCNLNNHQTKDCRLTQKSDGLKNSRKEAPEESPKQQTSQSKIQQQQQTDMEIQLLTTNSKKADMTKKEALKDTTNDTKSTRKLVSFEITNAASPVDSIEIIEELNWYGDTCGNHLVPTISDTKGCIDYGFKGQILLHPNKVLPDSLNLEIEYKQYKVNIHEVESEDIEEWQQLFESSSLDQEMEFNQPQSTSNSYHKPPKNIQIPKFIKRTKGQIKIDTSLKLNRNSFK